MILKIASNEAIKFSCMQYHYAKAVPAVSIGFSVFENDVFCGTVCYGKGSNRHIGSEFGLKQGECIELVRVALNGKQKTTTQAVAISIRLVKKYCPLVKMLVSYADFNQGHLGIIYQATNWYYIGEYANERGIMIHGKLTHRRSCNASLGTSSIEWIKNNIDRNAKVIDGEPKHKYVYPLDKSMIPLCEYLSKKYPKSGSSLKTEKIPDVQSGVGGSNPTLPHEVYL